MIKIENVEVTGWEAAIRGMRNPMNSWEKSDSFIRFCCKGAQDKPCDECCDPYCEGPIVSGVGKNDLALMEKLARAGSDHRKFMRMIIVYVDVVAPLYWWAEYDTYKVGTVANSCSKMHKIHAKKFTLNDFSHEHLLDCKDEESPLGWLKHTISGLNYYREKFNATGNKSYWWQLIQLLPSSYNQRRTLMLNYEVLANIYKSRRNHKLDCWITFCDWIETLPYSELITGKESK